MQQSPANLCFVNLSGCFLKPLVPTASWGKVLQSLMTSGVKSLCLPLVFHLLTTPQVPALWGQCSHCAQLATPGTHVCELWTSVIPPLGHFISSLFWSVVLGGGGCPTPLIVLMTLPWTFPRSNIPSLGSEEKNCTGYSRCKHVRNTRSGVIITTLFCLFFKKKNLFDFPYWWLLDTKSVFVWK